MKRWQLPILFLSLLLLFRYGVSTTVLSAEEIDALVAGDDLRSGLERGDSLWTGFRTHKEHPRAKQLRGSKGPLAQDNRQRAELLTPPLVRWVVGSTMIVTGANSLSDARWSAALAMALAMTLVCWLLLAAGTRWWFLGLGLVTPASMVFGAAVGAAALSCLVMALLLIAFKALEEGRSPLWVGLAWGLNLAVHPATVWFLIPIFILAARIYAAKEQPKSSPRPGRIALPSVPVTLLFVPVVALCVLAIMWPALWKDTTTGLFYWLTDAWKELASGQVVTGTSYEQPNDRAPLAWTAVLQWFSLLPLTVVITWCLGVWVCLKRGGIRDWTPILLTATLLLAGAVNGGLFGGRLSLFSLLLIPTLLTSIQGILFVRDELRSRGVFSLSKATAICASVVLGVAGIQWVTGSTNLGSSNGLESSLPVPYVLLEKVVTADGVTGSPVPVTLVGGDTLSKRGKHRWKHAVWTVSQRTPLSVSIHPANTSRWLLVLDSDPVDMPDSAVHIIPSGDPEFSQVVSGVRWDAYRL